MIILKSLKAVVFQAESCSIEARYFTVTGELEIYRWDTGEVAQVNRTLVVYRQNFYHIPTESTILTKTKEHEVLVHVKKTDLTVGFPVSPQIFFSCHKSYFYFL